MSRINLLPWRETQRQERQRNFIILIASVAVLAAGAVFGANQWVGGIVDAQENRNNFLRAEIRSLDRQIAQIEDLERTRDNLISRKNVIERLQENRSLMVHLFNQIAQTVPEGITLNSVRQTGSDLTILGTTESETRVSEYMRRIENAEWLRNPQLRIIQVEDRDRRPDQPFRFELRAEVGPPRSASEEA